MGRKTVPNQRNLGAVTLYHGGANRYTKVGKAPVWSSI